MVKMRSSRAQTHLISSHKNARNSKQSPPNFRCILVGRKEEVVPMYGDKHPEVLIAGAGPVGLFTALSLARRGVAVRIVDTGVWACTHSYALALQPQSLPLFEELGLIDRVMHNSYRVDTMVLADTAGPRARIAPGGGDSKSCLAVLRQDALEELLERALGEHGGQ